MKRLFTLVALCLLSAVAFAQKDVTKFLGIPVDGTKTQMIQKLKAKGFDVDFDELLKEIEQRDYNDMNRDFAPLKQADDAIYVDTSDMTIDEVINTVMEYIEK